MIEYEYNWDNSLPDMVQCVAFFDKIAAQKLEVATASALQYHKALWVGGTGDF